jgi:TatD DNase family protein
MLIDSHSHLHFHKSFPDFKEVVERAEDAGVMQQILIGCDMRDSVRACEFVQKKDGLNWTIGVHPHDAHEVTHQNLRIMRDVLSRTGEFTDLVKGPVAIGEIGLDYHRNIRPQDVQKDGFIKQLDMAKEFDLPVVAHIRNAFDDASEIVNKSGIKKLVLHCFTGSIEMAEWAWGHGYLISFTGAVTFPQNTALMEVVRQTPDNLYMLETDCPFLAPQIHRGKRNEPAFVRDIAVHVAQLRGESIEKVAADTTANAERFFGI